MRRLLTGFLGALAVTSIVGCGGEVDAPVEDDISNANNGKGDEANAATGPATLAEGLAFCEAEYEAAVEATDAQQGYTLAASEWATCAGDVTDSRLSAVEALLSDYESELAGTASATIDRYRAAMHALCEQVVLSSETPDGSLSTTARAYCSAQVEVAAAQLVGSWAYLDEEPRVAEIEARDLFGACYTAFDTESESADSQAAMNMSVWNLYDCLTAEMDTYRAERLAMAIDNSELSAEEVTAAFNAAFEPVTAASTELCELLVAASDNPEGSLSNLYRANCTVDAAVLTDRLFR